MPTPITDKSQIQPKVLHDRIVLKETNSIHILRIEDIIWCKAEGSYTKFCLEDGKEIMVSKNLKEYEQKLLPYGFFRPHHSYLVNLNHLVRFDRIKGGRLIMRNEDEIPVSVRKKEQIIEYLESY